MPQDAFDEQFDAEHRRPGVLARVVAGLIQKMPKIGPLKKMGFKYPGLQCEELYLRSMDSIMVNYEYALQKAGSNELVLANIDFDTGVPSVLNEYRLADATYQDWVLKLQNDQSALITPALKQNIIAFYNNGMAVNLIVNTTIGDEKQWPAWPLVSRFNRIPE